MRGGKPSQRDRVLKALERAGEHGITQVDFLAPGVIDGGDPITRLAARVHELINQDGHSIVKDGQRNACDVYKLIERAPERRPGWWPTPEPVASGATEGALF